MKWAGRQRLADEASALEHPDGIHPDPEDEAMKIQAYDRYFEACEVERLSAIGWPRKQERPWVDLAGSPKGVREIRSSAGDVLHGVLMADRPVGAVLEPVLAHPGGIQRTHLVPLPGVAVLLGDRPTGATGAHRPQVAPREGAGALLATAWLEVLDVAVSDAIRLRQ